MLVRTSLGPRAQRPRAKTRATRIAGALTAAALSATALASCGGDGLRVKGPAPNSSAATVTEITGCSGRGQRAPTRLALHCAAPRTTLEHLSWHGWGGPSAKASGTLVRGECDPGDPSCGDPAIVTATDLVLGARSDQYRELVVVTGTGAGRQTTRFAIDDRGPTPR